MMSVLERLTAISEHDVQRVGLSATVGNRAPHYRQYGPCAGSPSPLKV